MSTTPSSVGLVLPGGGARAAYQAGVLKAIGRRHPGFFFPIITGVSAGAINSSYLASRTGNLEDATADLAKIWGTIQFENVFRMELGSWTRSFFRWNRQDAESTNPGGLLDTSPLRHLLELRLGAKHDQPIPGITRNIDAGRLEAVALITVNYGTGQTISWVQGRNISHWERPDRRSRQTRLTADHVMASAALPLLFPAVELGDAWYGDGGIRYAAPLSPALHLGADKLLAISMRYDRSAEEAGHPTSTGYPSPALIGGNLLNAVFLDVIEQDVMRLERLNTVIRKVPPEERGGLKPVDILLIRPSKDLGKLAADVDVKLPRGFRLLIRSLGAEETESPDLLSLLLFQPDYLQRLVDLGEQDAEAQMDAIDALIES